MEEDTCYRPLAFRRARVHIILTHRSLRKYRNSTGEKTATQDRGGGRFTHDFEHVTWKQTNFHILPQV